MKVEEVRSYLLSAPLTECFFISQPGTITCRSTVVVEVRTDEGISGFGESLCHGLQPPQIAKATIDTVLRDMLLGHEVADVAVFHEYASNRLRDYGRQGATIGALSAIDIALWDALGQAAGRPVYELLGGAFRRQVRPYATGFYRTGTATAEDLVAEARRHRDDGFTAMKVKIGFGVADDLAALRAIREAVGPEITLMADANHAYNASIARRLLHGCDELGIHWLEEPITPEDIDGYAELRGLGTDVLIAAGEGECGAVGFWPWARVRALDVFQPDIAATGGFTAMRQISAIAQAAGILVNPHVWGTAIGLAASLQAIAALPPNPPSRGQAEPLLEYDSSAHPFRQELVAEQIAVRDGVVDIPGRPGIGVQVNREFLKRHALG